MGISVEIIFDRNPPVFGPGDRVSGEVMVKSTSKKSCKGVTFLAKGYSEISWSDREEEHAHKITANRRPKIVLRYSKEEYYNIEIQLLGDNTTDVVINEGVTAFGFTFKLPKNLPSSFDGTYGKVSHECLVKVLNSGFFSFNSKTAEKFTVIDDSIVHSASRRKKNSIFINDEDTISFWCCKPGLVRYQIRTDKYYYECGDNIIISGRCHNLTNWKLNYTQVSLIQEVLYLDRQYRKVEEIEICKLKHYDGVVAGEVDEWLNEIIPIPFLPPSKLNHCNIIYITYYLAFTLKPQYAFGLTTKEQIIIGNSSENQMIDVEDEELMITRHAR